MSSELLSDQDIEGTSFFQADVVTSGGDVSTESDFGVGESNKPDARGTRWYELKIHESELNAADEIVVDCFGNQDMLIWVPAPGDWTSKESTPEAGYKAGFPCAFEVADFIASDRQSFYLLTVTSPWAPQHPNLMEKGEYFCKLFYRQAGRDEAIVFQDDFSPVVDRATVFFPGGAVLEEEAHGPEASLVVEEGLLVEDGAISSEIAGAFRTAEEEEFEDGMESRFARDLSSLVDRYRERAIERIGELIVKEDCSSLVAAEALGCLGRMESDATRSTRRNILQEALKSHSLVVRDAAVLGLAELNDPSSRPFLEEARDSEPCPELHQDIQEILADLAD